MNDIHPRILTQGEKKDLEPDAIREVKFRYTHVSSKLSVHWSWYNENKGVVQWTFRNTDSSEHSVILLRNGYYFAGAFWPVYYANSDGRGASATNPNDNFGTDFLNGKAPISPLVNKGASNNNPPLGLVIFGSTSAADVSKSNSQVLFVFALSPNETWSMLEGGFSSQMTPTGISLYEVSALTQGDFCIGYDAKRVTDWDSQTNTTLQGYTPDPSTIDTWLLEAEAGAPFDELPYSDSYANGKCTT